MNKILYLICILSTFLISSCKINTKDVNKSIFIIEKFNLNHYSKDGSKLYMLETPYSVFNQTDQSYLLEKTNIKFFEKENVKYNINSDSAKLYNLIFEIILIKFFSKYGKRRGLGSNECIFLKF